MKTLSSINESFADVMARNKTGRVRKEDKLPNFGKFEFYKYIKDNYKYTIDYSGTGDDYTNQNSKGLSYFSIGLLFDNVWKKNYRLFIYFSNDRISKLKINCTNKDIFGDSFDIINRKFTVVQDGDCLFIYSNSNKDVSIDLCVNFINTIIENSSSCVLKKRT